MIECHVVFVGKGSEDSLGEHSFQEIPRKGDLIKLGDTYYEVTNVIHHVGIKRPYVIGPVTDVIIWVNYKYL